MEHEPCFKYKHHLRDRTDKGQPGTRWYLHRQTEIMLLT